MHRSFSRFDEKRLLALSCTRENCARFVCLSTLSSKTTRLAVIAYVSYRIDIESAQETLASEVHTPTRSHSAPFLPSFFLFFQNMKAITFVALVGGFFVAYNVAQVVKSRAHRARAETARERAAAIAAGGAAAAAGAMVTQQDWARTQGAPVRLLNRALSIDALDGAPAPPNN